MRVQVVDISQANPVPFYCPFCAYNTTPIGGLTEGFGCPHLLYMWVSADEGLGYISAALTRSYFEAMMLHPQYVQDEFGLDEDEDISSFVAPLSEAVQSLTSDEVIGLGSWGPLPCLQELTDGILPDDAIVFRWVDEHGYGGTFTLALSQT